MKKMQTYRLSTITIKQIKQLKTQDDGTIVSDADVIAKAVDNDHREAFPRPKRKRK